MTLCNLLMEKTSGNRTVSAWEKFEKFSATPYYEIHVCDENSFVLENIRAARTTWKKRFNETN